MICGIHYFIKKIDVEKHVNISSYFEAQFGPKIKIHPVVARGGGGGQHLFRCSISSIAQHRYIFMYAKFHAFNLKCKVCWATRNRLRGNTLLPYEKTFFTVHQGVRLKRNVDFVAALYVFCILNMLIWRCPQTCLYLGCWVT